MSVRRFSCFSPDFQLVTDTQTSKIAIVSADVGTTYFYLFLFLNLVTFQLRPVQIWILLVCVSVTS